MRIYPMRIFSVGFAAVLAAIVLSSATAPVHGQAGAKPAVNWTPPRTPDGHPDMQGIWNSVNSFFTPLQRPAALGDKEQVSEEELSKVLTDEAAKKLGIAIKATNKAEQKLALLQQYRDDYAARLQTKIGRAHV